MDKQQKKIIKRQLAHVNRETQLSDVRIRDLDMEKVWCCLAHLRTLERVSAPRQITMAA